VTPRHLKTLLATAALLVGAVAASACGVSNADSGVEGYETTTIRYQSISGGIIDPAELADALGYLGPIELERVGDVQGGPEALRATATGQVDYGGAFNGAIAKLAATGAPLTSVVSYYGSSGDVSSSVLVLEDSPVQEPEDLVGKKVAVNTLGANAEAVLDTWLRDGGLTEDEIADVTLVPLPAISTEAALRKGQIDAAYLFGAGRDLALEHGGLRTVVTDIDLVGEYNGGSLVMRDDFLAENPQTTEKFVGALAKAIDFAQTHEAQEVRDVMADYYEKTGRSEQVEALQLWRGTGVSTEGGVISEDDFTLWLDWLEAEGQVDEDSLDPGDLFTNEYNPYAEEAS
jgi:ABC-type nitrate/sulfonate/bicarbonate transport system substrate-binding protein